MLPMARKFLVYLTFLAFCTLVHPKFLVGLEDAAGKTYDFIVVGVGALLHDKWQQAHHSLSEGRRRWECRC